jgi:hypothetical protein
MLHSSAASAALYTLLPKGSNRCIEGAFIITVHQIFYSGFVSMRRKICFLEKK